MESGFSLGQVDEFLGNAFFAENTADHIVVAPGTGQATLKRAAATAGEVVDESSDLIGHHQRQIGVRGLDLGFGLGFDVRIGGGVEFVGFVDRSRLGLLFSESVALLQGGEFEVVDSVEQTVEFVLKPVVGFQVKSAAEKLVEGVVEILLGGFEVAILIVLLAGLIFLLDAGDQVSDGIDLERLRNLEFRLGCVGGLRLRLIRRLAGRYDRRSFGLSRRYKGCSLYSLTAERR